MKHKSNLNANDIYKVMPAITTGKYHCAKVA